MNIKYDTTSVKEYRLNYTQLSRYAKQMVADPWEQMIKFLFGCLT